MGSAIPFITPERLGSIKIPKPNENIKWISKNIEKYINNLEQAKIKENQAIQLVEKEIESWEK
jgi:type I restriction enzyme S subunit